MDPLYEVNGLMFHTEKEIRMREHCRDYFKDALESALLNENAAWKFVMVEAPLLTPRSLINDNYTNEDVWVQERIENTAEETNIRNHIANLKDKISEHTLQLDSLDGTKPPIETWEQQLNAAEEELKELLAHVSVGGEHELVLRPETTPGSYHYAQHLLNSQTGVKPPFVVWQMGKSFRREQEQPTKHCRFKEFYQLEFQCIYTADTMNDYHTAILEPVRRMIAEKVHLPTRIVESDRLPSYSEITMDVEVQIPDEKWMELCSISRRTDFPEKAKFQTKKGIIEKDLLVLEIAVGLDRVNYAIEKANSLV